MKKLLLLLFYLISAFSLNASEGVHQSAEKIGDILGFPITNSMVTSWVVSLVLILIIRLTVGKAKLIPGKGQLVIESVIDSIRSIIEPIVGKRVFFASFWLLSGLFFFILINNLSGLLPGVGTIGTGYYDDDGHFHLNHYFIRPGNADLNMTLALALVANAVWAYIVLRHEKLGHIAHHVFGPKATKKDVGPFFIPLAILFLAVGLIEVVSIMFRPVSLTFRLFGNVFGGESLLHSMFELGNILGLHETVTKVMACFVPVPFYFMEVLIGFVQALVFMLLVAVYIGLFTNHEEGKDH